MHISLQKFEFYVVKIYPFSFILVYLISVCNVGDLPGVDKVLPARVRVDGVELGEERLERRLGRLVVPARVLVVGRHVDPKVGRGNWRLLEEQAVSLAKDAALVLCQGLVDVRDGVADFQAVLWLL